MDGDAHGRTIPPDVVRAAAFENGRFKEIAELRKMLQLATHGPAAAISQKMTEIQNGRFADMVSYLKALQESASFKAIRSIQDSPSLKAIQKLSSSSAAEIRESIRIPIIDVADFQMPKPTCAPIVKSVKAVAEGVNKVAAAQAETEAAIRKLHRPHWAVWVGIGLATLTLVVSSVALIVAR